MIERRIFGRPRLLDPAFIGPSPMMRPPIIVDGDANHQ
jgi:hypothetical protein